MKRQGTGGDNEGKIEGMGGVKKENVMKIYLPAEGRAVNFANFKIFSNVTV